METLRTKYPLKRMKVLKMLSQEGIHTIVRLQPLMFPWIKEIVSDLIPMLNSMSCKHVIVEYLKLPVEKNISLRQITWLFAI